ncbi:MAG TPA: DNA-processing protein DprA [Bacteroidota bacterium]|nr:DNA-processing protein DprA [Bacteroidota bacterium]
MNVRDLLRLLSVPRIGPLKVRALISHFHDPAEVFKASPHDLIKVPGIDKKIASSIAHHESGERFADDQLKRVNKHGARIITVWDKEYPELLKKIYDPPPILYVFGAFTKADASSVAIVGTRRPSTYGENVAELFSKELAKLGITTVSGLARGIDTVVHSATLRSGGRTIAVIGSGLDIPYPSENKKLMERIAEEGVVVSEFPMGSKPDAPNFPRRNRIISGLSLATIVVESHVDGGAMITATTALDQNRAVFAIPGNITEPRSVGPHTLIRDGRAALAVSVQDVLEEIRQHLPPKLRQPRQQEARVELNLFEQCLYDLITTEPIHIDLLTERSEMTTSDALVNLLSLEFKGLVRQLPGKYFVRS